MQKLDKHPHQLALKLKVKMFEFKDLIITPNISEDELSKYPRRRRKVDLEQKQVREIYQIAEEDETSVISEIEHEEEVKENGVEEEVKENGIEEVKENGVEEEVKENGIEEGQQNGQVV